MASSLILPQTKQFHSIFIGTFVVCLSTVSFSLQPFYFVNSINSHVLAATGFCGRDQFKVPQSVQSLLTVLCRNLPTHKICTHFLAASVRLFNSTTLFSQSVIYVMIGFLCWFFWVFITRRWFWFCIFVEKKLFLLCL